MYLSDILKKSTVVYEQPKMIREQEFDYFARATTQVNGTKCIFLQDKKYAKQIDKSVSMVITTEEIFSELEERDCGFCLTKRPRDLYFELMNEYELSREFSKMPVIKGTNCIIGKYVSMADYNVQIGNNVVIEDFVQICPNVTIGDDTIIRAGSKIGVQTFNIYQYDGRSKQLFHNGQTVIGKNVLIGQNAVVEQALYHYGLTKIEDDCKLDANVLIGHNSSIGAKCEITAGTCVAGYVEIGVESVLRLGVLIGNGLSVGENSHIGMGSVVMRNIRPYSRTLGNPARDFRQLGNSVE